MKLNKLQMGGLRVHQVLVQEAGLEDPLKGFFKTILFGSETQICKYYHIASCRNVAEVEVPDSVACFV